VALPQNVKAAVAPPPMGQRHLRGARLSSEQGSELTTSSAGGADANTALSSNRWVRTCGRRIEPPLLRARGAAGFLPRDRPSRLILPMTALRLTPPSYAAIWLALSPSLQSFLSNSTRSSVQDMPPSFRAADSESLIVRRPLRWPTPNA